MRPVVAEAAERILGRAGGAAVRLTRWEHLHGGDRSKVWRARVHGGPAHAPASVVVKTAVAADGTGPAWRLFNEWASLELLGRLAPERPLVPRLYGGDRAVGVLVLEDVRAGAGLDRLLLGDDPDAAEDALVGHAGALGRMHALTAAHGDEYTTLRASPRGGPRPDRWPPFRHSAQSAPEGTPPGRPDAPEARAPGRAGARATVLLRNSGGRCAVHAGLSPRGCRAAAR